MARLLTEAAGRGVAPCYTSQLLAAFPDTQIGKSVAHQPLLHPLTERELDVLRLLPTGQTGPQIADQLFLANNTIKTHMRNIYSKLNVNNRAQAIKSAQALDLIP